MIDKPDDEKCAACSLGPPDWHYVCQDCQNKFTMPAPKGPADEKGRSCPKCRSKNIKWTGTAKSEACPPGG